MGDGIGAEDGKSGTEDNLFSSNLTRKTKKIFKGNPDHRRGTQGGRTASSSRLVPSAVSASSPSGSTTNFDLMREDKISGRGKKGLKRG